MSSSVTRELGEIRDYVFKYVSWEEIKLDKELICTQCVWSSAKNIHVWNIIIRIVNLCELVERSNDFIKNRKQIIIIDCITEWNMSEKWKYNGTFQK